MTASGATAEYQSSGSRGEYQDGVEEHGSAQIALLILCRSAIAVSLLLCAPHNVSYEADAWQKVVATHRLELYRTTIYMNGAALVTYWNDPIR